MGLALSLEVGQSAIIEVPYETADGGEDTDEIEVKVIRKGGNRLGLVISAPQEFKIRRSESKAE